MARLFGTDGVRVVANSGLDCNLAMKIGQVKWRRPPRSGRMRYAQIGRYAVRGAHGRYLLGWMLSGFSWGYSYARNGVSGKKIFGRFGGYDQRFA